MDTGTATEREEKLSEKEAAYPGREGGFILKEKSLTAEDVAALKRQVKEIAAGLKCKVIPLFPA